MNNEGSTLSKLLKGEMKMAKPDNLFGERINLHIHELIPDAAIDFGEDDKMISNSREQHVENKVKEEFFNFFITCFFLKKKAHLKEFIEEFEKAILIKTLSIFNGNQKIAAKFLGIKYTTLNEKVRRHNIHFHKYPIENVFQSKQI